MRTAYTVRNRQAIEFKQPSIAVQYFKEQCDINNILAKYKSSGVLFATKTPPTYGDFTEVQTYQDAQNLLIQAQESFNDLPSDVRRYFNNDPREFIEFASDQKNLDEMRRLGLAPDAQEIPPEILKNEGTEPAE